MKLSNLFLSHLCVIFRGNAHGGPSPSSVAGITTKVILRGEISALLYQFLKGYVRLWESFIVLLKAQNGLSQ